MVSRLHEDVLHKLGASEARRETHGAVLEQQRGGDVLHQVKPVGLLTASGNFAPVLYAAHLVLLDGFL